MKQLLVFVAPLWAKIRREPVVAIAAVAAVSQAVATYLAHGGAFTFAAVAPIVAGALARQVVSPAYRTELPTDTAPPTS